MLVCYSGDNFVTDLRVVRRMFWGKLVMFRVGGNFVRELAGF